NNLDDYNIQDPSKAIIEKVGGEWRLNQVGDYVLDASQPLFLGSECSPFLEINEANIDQNLISTDGDFTTQILSDKNIAYRLILDSEEGRKHQFFVRQVLTNINFPIQ